MTPKYLLLLLAAAILGTSALADPCTSALPVRLEKRLDAPAFLRHRSSAQRLLVFVHGLAGDATQTWTNANGTYWPELVNQDGAFQSWDIYIFGYPSGFFRKCHKIPDLASELHTRLDDIASQYQTIVFVAHSQGGLIVRESLLTYPGAITDKTVALILFGTPTGGSGLADFAGLLTRCVDDLRSIGTNSFLKQQNYHWQQSALASKIRTTCAYEDDEKVVDQASASLLCTVTKPLFEQHSALVKPACDQDSSHVILRDAIRDIERQYLTRNDDNADEELTARLRLETERARGHEVLEFWDTIVESDVVSAAEAAAILNLRLKPLSTRLAVLDHAFRNDSAARRFLSKHRSIMSAVARYDSATRDRIVAQSLTPATLSPTTEAVRKALSVAGSDLQVEVPHRTVSESTGGKDYEKELRDRFFSSFSEWPLVAAALQQLSQANVDRDRAAAIQELGLRWRSLSVAAQSALRRRYTQEMISNFYWGRRSVCRAMEVIGGREAIRDHVKADVSNNRPAPT